MDLIRQSYSKVRVRVAFGCSGARLMRRRQRDGARARSGASADPAGRPYGELAKSLALGLLAFVIIRTFLFQTFVVTSGSMRPTVMVGDMLVASRVAIGPRIPGTQYRLPGLSAPARGDVAVFTPHHVDDLTLIKRLVGLPGDTLQMSDGELLVNGEPLFNQCAHPVGEDVRENEFLWQRNHLVAGVDPESYAPTLLDWGPIEVPDEHYFMLGDNRGSSLDSRYWGFLAAWRLEARASFVYYSYDRRSHRPLRGLLAVRPGRVGTSLRASCDG